MKFRKDLIDVMKGAAVYCDAEEKAEALLAELDKSHVYWNGDCNSLASSHTCFNEYENGICYSLGLVNNLLCCDKSYYLSIDYKIFNFEEVLEGQENRDNNFSDLLTTINSMVNGFTIYAENMAKAYKDGYIRACEDLREEFQNILLNNNTE